MEDPYIPLVSENGYLYVRFSEVVHAYMEQTNKSYDDIIEDFCRPERLLDNPDLPNHGHWIAGDACVNIGGITVLPLYMLVESRLEVGDSLVTSVHIRETSIDCLTE